MAGRSIHDNGFPLSFDLLEIIRRRFGILFSVHVPHPERSDLWFATSLTSVAATGSRQPREPGSGRGNGPSRSRRVLIVFGGGDLNGGKVRGLHSRSTTGVDGQIWW